MAERIWTLLALLCCAGPLVALLGKGAARLSGTLLVHLGVTVLPMQLGYSLLVAGGAAILAVLLALGGVGCATFAFPGRRVLEKLVLLPLLVPGWFLAEIGRDRQGLHGWPVLALVLGVSGAPLVVLLGAAALRSLPRQYFSLLRVLDRATPGSIIRVLGPLAVPAMGAAATLVFLLAWSDAASARVLAVPTLTVGLGDQWFGREDDRAGAVLALVLLALSLIPALALSTLVRRAAVPESPRLQAAPAPRLALRGWRGALPWLLSLPQLLIGVLYPAMVIASWVSQRLERTNLGGLGTDLAGTLFVAGGGTLLGALLAVAPLRTQAMSGRPALTSGAATALFALPSSVLGLVVLWMLAAPEARGLTAWLNAGWLPLIAALGARSVAVFVAAGEVRLRRRAAGQVVMARLLGRTGPFAFLRLFRPHLAGPTAVAAAFVFLEGLKDLTLSTLLQPFGRSTLATRLFQHVQTQSLPDCAVWVLCVALVGLYPLVTLSRRDEPRPGEATF